MSNWQLAPVTDDEEDWLHSLASETDKERVEVVRREVTDSFEFADTIHFDMLESTGGQ
jgi:transcriptional regulator CtsR